MADETENGNGTGRRKRPKQEGPTKRVVLRREDVIVLTDLDQAQRDAVVKAVGAVKAKGMPRDVAKPRETWSVVGMFDGDSKTKAIEAHAGKPGTPDAKEGAFKAPTVSAWAGGEVYERPPAPLFERKALEDVIAS